MKLYNPFKPHIVKHGGVYYIRRLCFFGWRFLDSSSFDYWWSGTSTGYGKFSSLEKVKKAFDDKAWKFKRVNCA